MDLTVEQLEHRFQFHPADADNTKAKHQQVRDTCLQTAKVLVEMTGPPTREQSLAITHLEEAMFWANAAIARGDGPKS